ncbi:MAG: amidohydrolase [Oscillospiraceae bacterium]|nr:amidohydrolase [Oscillospiraceae bacterium]
MYIYNAKIFPMDCPVIENGFVRAENGIIREVSAGNPKEITAGDFNAESGLLFPGFIDPHSHIGLIGDGMGAEGEDVNEDSDPITPHLRTIDGLNFTDNCFADAVKCGVTTAVTGVGSSNPIGGDFIAVKTHGRCADEMLIRRVGIKFALGENPKSSFSDKDSAPVTRMATAALIREALFKAGRYMHDKLDAEENGDSLPEYDIKSEALIPLLKREIKAHFHCHRADDIMTAVRIAKEFNLDYVLVHCTEGHIIADILGEEEASALIGPVICDRGKPELAELTTANAGILYKNGVHIAICTDHPEIPVQYLAASAAYCVKAGLPYEEALRALTVNPAKIIGIYDRVGSLTVGKDADMVVFDGNPLEIMTSVKATFIGGKACYRKEN